MKYTITTTLLFFALILGAQSPDMDRMKRDIEVGENILASLLEESYEGFNAYTSAMLLGDGSNVEGSYLEGFGVLFTIAPRRMLGAVNWGQGNYIIRDNQTMSITIPDTEGKGKGKRGRTASGFASTGDTDTISLEAKFKEMVETFAVDYAYLMRRLPADEKIMIRYGGKQSHSGTWSVLAGGAGVSSFSSQSVYSAVIEKSDLEAHQNGRLSQAQLVDKIKFTSEKEGTNEENRDLTLLTSIFSRLYQSDLSSDETFKLRGTPKYENIEGLGAVVYLSVGPKRYAYSYYFNGVRIKDKGSNRINIVVPDERGDEKADAKADSDTDEDKADEIDDAYPDFMSELEQNIVEYGSIVKDLAKDEALIFKINFFDCKDCEVMPEKIEITAMQSTLAAYRKGNISLDKAVGQLKISMKE